MTTSKPPTGLARNWVSYVGGLIATFGLAAVLFALTFELSARQPSPYIGIFTYLVFPAVIAFGVLTFFLGTRLESRRRRRAGTTDQKPYPALDLNVPSHRRGLQVTLGVMTVGGVLMTITAYRGFLFTESVEFCGKTCHAPMGPEMTAYARSPHARVPCVECHVGNGASFYMHSKVNGVRQLYGVLTNTYERPIKTPIKGLRPARETCQECHWMNEFWGSKLYQRAHFRYDETSTPEQISMAMRIGGGADAGSGVHWHMLVENEVSFVAEDEQLQQVPWVKVKRKDGSTTEFFRTERRIEQPAIAALEHHTMDCVDCHNRPAHRFESADVAVDQALFTKAIPATLPFAKSLSVDALSKEYATSEAAHAGMRQEVTAFYAQKYPDVMAARAAEVATLASQLDVIYDRNVFPSMKVGWQTYPSNLGHRNSAGCFRCHDGKHVAADGKRISSECTACHSAPRRGPQTQMGELMTTAESDWHPWQTPEKHLAIPRHAEVQCYECHAAGRRPKTECNECHAK